jgi:hypothetical protein
MAHIYSYRGKHGLSADQALEALAQDKHVRITSLAEEESDQKPHQEHEKISHTPATNGLEALVAYDYEQSRVSPRWKSWIARKWRTMTHV